MKRNDIKYPELQHETMNVKPDKIEKDHRDHTCVTHNQLIPKCQEHVSGTGVWKRKCYKTACFSFQASVSNVIYCRVRK